MLTKLYEGEYIDKLVYEYVEKNKDHDAKEQLQALEAMIPELMAKDKAKPMAPSGPSWPRNKSASTQNAV